MQKHNRRVIVLILAVALLVLPLTSLTRAQTTDIFEPDNGFSQFSSMNVTSSVQSQSRSIYPIDDNDYIRFFATPGQYTFYTSSPTSTNTYGYIYASNFTQLVYDDDSGGNLQFKIVYTILNTDYYFLRVRGYNINITGDYTLYYSYVPYLGTLNVSPSSGPGGVSVNFKGSGYPASSTVDISYFDPTFGAWNYFRSVTSNSTGGFVFATEMPDLRRSVGAGDYAETFNAISFRSEVAGTLYCLADYNEYLRGIKTVGTQTATGLYGNGTSLVSSVSVRPGDTIGLSGKWFHSGSVIYVRWDSVAVVGTVNSNEWSNAVIIGTSLAGVAGSFAVNVTIPNANTGAHYIAVEDSETRITIQVMTSLGSLQLSPSSGPGGVSVNFKGSGYPASSTVDISYFDPTFGAWNYFRSVTSNSTGGFVFATEMPDLRRSVGAGDYAETFNAISFRSEVAGTLYCLADYNEYLRGIKTVGTQTATGLYGNGTSLVSSVSVRPGDTIGLSGKWFHSGSVIYVRWDSVAVVGTVNSNEWSNAVIIGTSLAGVAGSFAVNVTIPNANTGAHYIAVEDSETRITFKIFVYSSTHIPGVWWVDDNGLADFSTIQAAINAASPGDQINVNPGTYYENVIVNKSVSLFGQDQYSTIIDCRQSGNGVVVSANNAVINGFTIQNSGSTFSGVLVTSLGTTISGNSFVNNYYGIRLNNSVGTVIIGNSISNYYFSSNSVIYGIYLQNSSKTTVSQNNLYNAYNNAEYGIYLTVSSNNTIAQNSVHNANCNAIISSDIYLASSPNNTIIQNDLSSYNCIGNYGLFLGGSPNCNITNNNVFSNSNYGISLSTSGNSYLRNNVMTSNNGSLYIVGANITDYTHNIDTTNTVEGYPVYYWLNVRNMVVPSNAGCVMLINCTNISVQNLNLASNGQAILLAFTIGTTIQYNTIFNCRNSIEIRYSTNNTIRENKIFDAVSYGIFVFNSNNNIIAQNNVTGIGSSGTGIYLGGSGNNTLRNNKLLDNTRGFYVVGSSLGEYLNDVDTSNTINSKPLYYWINKTNQATPFDAGAIVLVNCSKITTQNYNSLDTIILAFTRDSIIQNNAFLVPLNFYRIEIRFCSNNVVKNNNILSGTSGGISIYNSTSFTVTKNGVANPNSVAGYGIYLYNTTNSVFQENTVDRTSYGIFLTASSNNNTIFNNTLSSNTFGINIGSSSNSNTIYSNNIYNNYITSASYGIYLTSSSNNTICNNKYNNYLSSTSYAIYLGGSSNNTISGNNLTITNYGIYLTSSSSNNIYRNAVQKASSTLTTYGFYLSSSSNNTIYKNNITSNNYGIYLYSSSGNRFYYNNMNNPTQILTSMSTNTWDNGYPAGGNYWSNYAGVDSNHDGIGDSPYIIDVNNQDHYPLMNPWNPTLTVQGIKTWYWTSATTINSIAVGDVNGDGKKETVTGGTYFDGTRNIAQLIVWNSSSLSPERLITWYWTGNTTINSVAIDDVDGDGQTEIVTGGSYFDGSRHVAQLCVWNGVTLALENVKTWYWSSNTVINSVALGDVDGDAQMEIVTGGYYNDGTRNVAQLVVWAGSSLSVERLTGWYWTGNTVINSVAVGDVDSDGQVEIVTGGYYNDGVRNVAQLIEWNGLNLSVDRLAGWYWTGNTVVNSVALGDVDGDGQVEIVSGGYYNDGVRNIAQLIEWNGVNLAVDRLNTWYWNSNTVVNSVALGDVDCDGQVEVVSGGYFNDGVRNVSQLTVWSGSSLAAENIKTWYWTSNTAINSVAAGDVNCDFSNEIATGGAFYDGTRLNSQLTVWGMT